MALKYILYNPAAGDDNAAEALKTLQNSYESTVLINICRITNYKTFFDGLEGDADVILCGGDGTLNRFVNEISGITVKNEIYYFPSGTGNDFAKDLGYGKYASPVINISKYLKRLPAVTVNGKTSLFLNNVGFGIDGYCCETGDMLRERNRKNGIKKPVNYTKIAITGLLFRFKHRNAEVTVDGKKYSYKKVWLAPVMNGRYYGGGMMAAPKQDRLSSDGKVSLVLFHDVGKLKALMIFPSIFEGKHVEHTKYITVLEGNDISVTFDCPTPLQIDGETISGVTSYSVFSVSEASAAAEAEAKSAAAV